MIIERVALPGIGVCHTATSARRQRFGVVCHRTGRRDLIVYDPHDPERATQAVVLDAAEAKEVAELLAAAVTVDHIAEPGGDVSVVRLRVPVGSPYDGRALGDACDVASVVAVVRDGQVSVGPDPATVLRHGDTLIAVGEPGAVAALAASLRDGRAPSFDPPPRRFGRRGPQPVTGPPR